jgi:hypothetical protein
MDALRDCYTSLTGRERQVLSLVVSGLYAERTLSYGVRDGCCQSSREDELESCAMKAEHPGANF